LTTSFFSVYILPASLGLLMFGMGLSLSLHDFERVLVKPRGLIAGLICQMILLPLFAFGIASISGLPPAIKTGIIIIAASPGGATSNLITYLLRGNVALSISMTAVNSVMTLVSVPLIIYLGLQAFMGEGEVIRLPVLNTILNVFLVTVLPTSLGVFTKYRFPIIARKLEKPGRYILPAIYAVIFLIAMLGTRRGDPMMVSALYMKTAPYAFILNILGMLAGYGVAKWLRYGRKTQITLSVEVGIQNSALAITIASSALFLNEPMMAIPAVIYGFFTFFSAIAFGIIINRSSRIRI